MVLGELIASVLPRGLLNACSEVYSKLRPQDEDDEDKEGLESGQGHIYQFYDELTEEEKAELDADYDSFKLEEFEAAWGFKQTNDFNSQGIQIDQPRLLHWELKKPPTPGHGANISKVSDVSERKLARWRDVGLKLYLKNRVAIVILSGGKDSHLREGVPKGVLDIGLLSCKSIFQLYFQRIARLQHLVHRAEKKAICIPVYIMCNSENRTIIEDFFHENNFFGLMEQNVLFFTQANFPVCDAKGKILLREKHRIMQEPNGNGGLFKALLEEGMISDMKSRGVTAVFVGSIDNVLGKVGDPTFIGHCEECKTEAGIKCVEKLSPSEHFGVFVSKTHVHKFVDVDGDGKIDDVNKSRAAVVEFFELPEDLKKRRQRLRGTNPLSLSSANISQYYFKVDFIKRVHSQMNRRWHAIPKTASYINLNTGSHVEVASGEHNARRLEMFVFDSFEFTKSVVGLEVERNEFANIKNMTGPDSPQTALVAMGRLHQQWIAAAGGKFVDQRIATEREDLKCEISPLVSYAGEDLGGQFPMPIQLPFYLPSRQELLEFSAAASAQTRRGSMHYLDWYSDLCQRELQIEMNHHLGGLTDAIEDPSALDYMGERASDEELLPPTPRQAIGKFAASGPSRHQALLADDEEDEGDPGGRQSPKEVEDEMEEEKEAEEGQAEDEEQDEEKSKSKHKEEERITPGERAARTSLEAQQALVAPRRGVGKQRHQAWGEQEGKSKG